MRTVLLFADRACSDDADRPAALTVVGGLTLIERQLRQFARRGIERAIIIAGPFGPIIADTIAGKRRLPVTVTVVEGLEGLADAIPEDTHVLLAESHILIDDRIIDQILRVDGDSVLALFPPHSVIPYQNAGTLVTMDSDTHLFASVARVQTTDLVLAGQPNQSMLARLLAHLAARSSTAGLDVTSIHSYIPARSRDVALLWRPVADPRSRAAATRHLIRTTRNGVLDWPVRWLYPALEDRLIEGATRTFLTPNMMTILTALMGLAVALAFARGHLLPALAGGLVVAFFDGLDGKFARTTLRETGIGKYKHLIARPVEYAGYFGLAWFLATENGSIVPWLLAILVMIFSLVTLVLKLFYRDLSGRSLDDAGTVARSVKLVAGNRNTQLWALVPFALYAQWYGGLWMIAGYASLTFFATLGLFVFSLRDYAIRVSPVMEKNLSRPDGA